MRFIEKLNNILLLVLGSVALATAGPAIDNQFPVVDPFMVAHVAKVNTNTIEISGWAKKLRECKVIEVTVLAHNKDNIASLGSVEFLDSPTGELYSRPKSPDRQNWGPWRITVPNTTEKVDISALYQCHVLWNTRTHYTTLNLKDYP